MNLSVELKKSQWNLSRSAYEEIGLFPLMHSPGPVLVILASYLLFVLKLGPAFMRKREPFKFTSLLAIYNGFQVALSVYLVVIMATCMLKRGFLPKVCLMHQETARYEILAIIWWYFAAKVSELLDTVFFVLRKKYSQVTFLHLYHHSIMMIGTWAMLKYSPTQTVLFVGITNSMVHIVMYTYYGLASFGTRFQRYLRWKKYITTMQLIQFVSQIFGFAYAIKTCDCPPTKGLSVFIALNVFAFLLLFLNFYKQTYKNGKTQMTNGTLLSDHPVQHEKLH
ncbi:hypothetical protein ACJJTC_015283 [Scirpophaga incertulas]